MKTATTKATAAELTARLADRLSYSAPVFSMTNKWIAYATLGEAMTDAEVRTQAVRFGFVVTAEISTLRTLVAASLCDKVTLPGLKIVRHHNGLFLCR